jgi:GNAT superfamily N-acetyltransferase
MAPAELRPMRDADVEPTRALMLAAFGDLARRMHEPDSPPGPPEQAHGRIRHLLATDPEGAWVSTDAQGRLTGAALAIMREGLWGLSLLVVQPDAQSSGIGSALLRRALDYGADARGAVILASPDPRALRAYARAGFALHPTVRAVGVPRDLPPAPAVRPFRDEDHALAAAVGRAVRGAAHGADIDAMARTGSELLVLPERGFAARRAGQVVTIAALDDAAAAELLRALLARVPAGATAEVDWLSSSQQWAIDVAIAARLELRPAGAVLLRGETGPLRPYIPSGAYL